MSQWFIYSVGGILPQVTQRHAAQLFISTGLILGDQALKGHKYIKLYGRGLWCYILRLLRLSLFLVVVLNKYFAFYTSIYGIHVVISITYINIKCIKIKHICRRDVAK